MTDKPAVEIEIDWRFQGEGKILGGSDRDQWNDRLLALVTRAFPVDQKNVDAISRAGSGAAAGHGGHKVS